MVRIGFIFDSKNKTGSGHFWRCFNLSKILKKNNREFFFISNFLNKQFVKILKKEGINYIKISSLNNISILKKTIDEFKLEIFITDYYDLNYQSKKEIDKKVKCLIVIDDHINKKHHCSLYINSNFMSKKTVNNIKKLNPKTKVLLGTKYFIRSNKLGEFQNKLNRIKKLKKVFVFFGSSDPTNETLKFIKSIQEFKDIEFKILIGGINKNYKKIKRLCNNKENIKLFYNFNNDNTLKLIKNNDISFGAGGVNLTERLFLNLPSVVICTADNQKNALLELKKKKIINYLGNHRSVSSKKIKNSIKDFLNNPNKINLLSKKAYNYYGKKIKTNLIKKEINILIKKKLKYE